jgi:flagella basal body P-ring formation protein FlgA
MTTSPSKTASGDRNLPINAVLILVLALFSTAATASARQDLTAINQTAEQFLRDNTRDLSDTVNVFTEPLDQRINLAACDDLQAFVPNGGRLWGKTSVGVKCASTASWTIYVQATVQIIADYIATATPVASGQIINESHLTTLKGDLSTLPASVITSMDQAIGRIAGASIRTGTPLRQDALRSQPVVQQGQSIRLITAGPGFEVSMEGIALNTATEGQTARAKTASGQVVSGIAKFGGIVEVRY